MENNQNFKSNISSTSKEVKFEYHQTQKQSSFFRGEIINNDKQPKKLSYDKTEKIYSSRIKESENEPKLLLEKLPQAFHFKNSQNSNDSKTSTQTKNSASGPKNNYNKISLDYSEGSPDFKNPENVYKQKKRSEERKKINNFFIEEEINMQKHLQMKRNHTQNNKLNNAMVPLKIVSKKNNDFLDTKKSSTDYNKNIFIYNIGNNLKNNNHLKTDLSEYENLRPSNNLIDLGYNTKNNCLKNSTFNMSMKEKLKNSEKLLKEKNDKSNNKNILHIYNEALNMPELYKNSYRKSSDSDAYPTKIKNMDNTLKKNERSGSCMNMNNYQDFNKLETFDSPNITIINNNTITNNTFLKEANTIKGNDNLRISAKPLLHPIIPNRKFSNETGGKKISKIFNNNNIKVPKVSIITDNLFNKVNLNISKKNIIQSIKRKKKEIEIENINEGISYKFNNGYKYYFNLRHINIYFLKEVQFNLAKGVSTSIKSWKKIFNENNNYLKIICRKLNTPENHYTFVLEYPFGGESLYDIVNSIGLTEPKIIYYIISEIYKNILILKNEKNEIIKEYQNISFCLCDLFLTINEELKIIPPVIRKIPINSSKTSNNEKNKKENNSFYNNCDCKKYLDYLFKQKNIPKNNISFFCLGLSILQIITQNFLFYLESYKILMKNKNYFQCCLIHSLKNIEEKFCDSNKVLLSLFLTKYDNKLINFIHYCTQFKEIDKSPNSDFIDLYYMMGKKINISMKELFKIINLSNNHYISLDNFLKSFKLLFNDMKINKNNFKILLYENKVIDVIRRNFNIEKNQLKNKIYYIIDNNNDLNDELFGTGPYENFINSGDNFFNSSFLKNTEKDNKNVKTIINDTINNENKKSCFNYNKNNIIFKNYNSNENNNI